MLLATDEMSGTFELGSDASVDQVDECFDVQEFTHAQEVKQLVELELSDESRVKRVRQKRHQVRARYRLPNRRRVREIVMRTKLHDALPVLLAPLRQFDEFGGIRF